MELYKISKSDENKHRKKRVGRGGGSGKGFHTSGRGQKGQKARAGHNIPSGFEGGQVPLYKKLPVIKRFKKPSRRVLDVSLSVFKSFKEGEEVTPKILVERGIIKKFRKGSIKVLDKGEVSKTLKLKGFLFSKAAKEKLEKAGSVIS